MSVIPATSSGVRDMADGSLRITLEFDPMHAKEAYALFGARGTPCAIAALTQEAATHSAQAETIAKSERATGLWLLAVQWCKEPDFWEWLNSQGGAVVNEVTAADSIKFICNISSRKELNTNPEAAEIFNQQIRIPYMAWWTDRLAEAERDSD